MKQQTESVIIEQDKKYPIRIELPFSDLPGDDGRTNSVRKECYLELYGTYVVYKVIGSYTEMDEGIPKEKKANYRWTRSRKLLSEVSMYYDNTFKKYTLFIDFQGITPSGNNWHFDTGEDCLVEYNKLHNYFVESLL